MIKVRIYEDFEDAQLAFVVSGSWYRTTTSPTPYRGSYCFRSKAIGHSQSTSATFTINIPSYASSPKISMRVMASSEDRFDYLSVFVNGQQVWSGSGNISWTLVTKELQIGSNTIELRYTKDSSISYNLDCGAVDDIEITYEVPLKYLIQDGSEIKTLPLTNILPASMTANNMPAPYVASASSELQGTKAYMAFDGDINTIWSTNNTASGWLQLDLGVGNQKTVVAYAITIRSDKFKEQAPKNWTLKGSNNGTNWTVIDSQVHEVNWNLSETRLYIIDNPSSYRYYRLDISANNGNAATSIAQLELLTGESVSWMTVGSSPVTVDMFNNYGMPTLSHVSETALRQLTSPTLLVLSSDILDTNMKLQAVPNARVIFPSDDIPLTIVDKVESFNLSVTESGSGIVRVIVSVDSGATWKTWDGSSWIPINENDLFEVKNNGISPTTFNSLSSSNWMALIGDSKRIRFAYYLEMSSTTDEAETDLIVGTFDLKGYWDGALLGMDYVYRYPDNVILQVILYASGDFSINY